MSLEALSPRASFLNKQLANVAVIAALLAERVDGVWHVRSLGAPHIGQRPEAELISAFAERLAELHPTLVSFNGSASIFRFCATAP